MDRQTKAFFDALHNDRAEDAKVFAKPAYRKFWAQIVEKYSDRAHYVYELIQNADDAGATEARFVLEPDRLIFAHNGPRHFSISNPATEESDESSGRLGDLNSITGISFSNKDTQVENKIGKFGVGFKSVFQCTASPRIYDPSISFRLDQYIVPSLLEDDFRGRKNGETLFVFPFDRKDTTPEKAYSDIEQKLKTLSNPILFLPHLREVSIRIGDFVGKYDKTVIKCCEYEDGTTAEKLELRFFRSDRTVSDSCNLWLFSRLYQGLPYSVGFYLNSDNKLLPAKEPAYCYFPTKETTDLRFIIHAPFLLTDSREGVRTGVEHNKTLIGLLAKLSASALLRLRDIGEEEGNRIIDDGVFSIIPTDCEVFEPLNSSTKVSLRPFYDEIKAVFDEERVIPTKNGYTTAKHAYWAAFSYLTDLFDDEKLAEICRDNQGKWAFVSIGREDAQRNNKTLFAYLDRLTHTSLSEEHLIRGRYKGAWGYYAKVKDIDGLTASFIEKQNPEWLNQLYKWLSETANRINMAKTIPIFLDQDSKAVSAFDDSGKNLQLFLPDEAIFGYRTIRADFLECETTREFIEKIGIAKPELLDEILNVIVPQYDGEIDFDTDIHFTKFFNYYLQCPVGEVDEYISRIKDCPFLYCESKDSDGVELAKAADIYFPSAELMRYFEPKPSTKFLDYKNYENLVIGPDRLKVKDFLIKLGIKTVPSVYRQEEKRYYDWRIESIVDGLHEISEDVAKVRDLGYSSFLWKYLCDLISKEVIEESSFYTEVYYRPDGRYNWRHSQTLNSDALSSLKSNRWLVNKDGVFVNASEVNAKCLHEKFSVDISGAAMLLDFLSISEDIETVNEDDGNDIRIDDDPEEPRLTPEEQEAVDFAQWMKEQNLTPEELKELVRKKQEKEIRKTPKEPSPRGLTKSKDDIKKVAEEIFEQVPEPELESFNNGVEISSVEEVDEDEYTPSPVDFEKRAEKEKAKAARTISRIASQESLQRKALESPRYSFAWFKALLELELINSNANNSSSKEISISFAKIEREPGTQRTLILRHPSRYIPQFMEDLADIPVEVHFEGYVKRFAIEVANVKSYTLRVKLKADVDISQIDFSQAIEAKIEAKSPSFLLKELRDKFLQLEKNDDFDMLGNLCSNIEFIFGPPGTGKTTYLAKNVILPLMQGREAVKVLVLAPTNKAADVLTKRIMEVMEGDSSYSRWLVRFGGTGDESIEKCSVSKDKAFDIRELQKSVTVTTIARFPYDYFMPVGERLYLNELKWDYIVIDEASMIPLVNIIYPLYKKTPRKFIVSGDPFQIEPITSVDLWKDENIYTLVGLDSFAAPRTRPHRYDVRLLKKQYRSLPSVGSIFSTLTYDGILEHHRTEQSKRRLNIESALAMHIESLNIIKFPVSKYESIYRSKRLQGSSSYHVYSAIFTFEFAVRIARAIAEANPREEFRIGIISPYRAQADLIDKLVSSETIPAGVDVQVGTIHGFQGDECDIIFAVFNAPPVITSGVGMFLNKKNIINVSISRAKDYLFIVMPDDSTEGVENLRLVNRVERLIKESARYEEIDSHNVEEIIFGSSTYLEDNAFSTSHQSVNVYGLPEKRYEIRSEDSAIDIQIHRHRSSAITDVSVTASDIGAGSNAISGQGVHEEDIHAHEKPVPKPEPQPSSQISFYWLGSKTKVCPLDGERLGFVQVPVLKKTGVSRLLGMQECPKCGNRFMLEKQRELLSSFVVQGKMLPIKSTSGTGDKDDKKTSQDKGASAHSSRSVLEIGAHVHSPFYGRGQIVKRENKDGKSVIIVQFGTLKKPFDEEVAFKNKNLIAIRKI